MAGESTVGGNVFEYKIIGSSDMDFGGAWYCPKKRKSLQGEAQKPYAKQASQENHQVFFLKKFHLDFWQDGIQDSPKKLDFH